ncbi:bifunctional 2',3'-cyclic-nucleotide 2'-phosphodiesterase/3'-nucleotidase [Indiicoccus explosivorum]|uniref:bifunctional 2',3'-cyclic-nucleotide 2'-phosphodiesterase/3'-nucleotidase n=1 Tax=Indiicoccus explosivorum TaxID=1917864 RepID=UPI000B42EBA4|nr:bifunctional 2',3'-cyclic-nucleotide 2'-phosphodiesterase/3'-nucleotidase [Indiicoccus explosivorum]
MGRVKQVSALFLALVLVLSGFTSVSAGKTGSDDVTRGEYIQAFIEALDVELGDGSTIPFTDVSDELAPYVEAAYEWGLTKGKSADLFAPEEKLTREQAFVIATRAVEAEFPRYPIAPLKEFKDYRLLAKSLLPELAKAHGMFLMKGYSDKTLKPKNTLKENEAQAIIARVKDHYPVIVKPVTGKEVSLQILATSDLHTNFVNYNYYQDKVDNSVGLAKTAVLIEAAREENPNTLLFDNGDLIQGTPFGSYKVTEDPLEADELHPAYAALESLDFDASTLGNHEFNFGLPYLENALEEAPFPVLNANVYDAETNENEFTPYVVEDRTVVDASGNEHTIQVGVIGVVAPQIMKWDKANLEGKVYTTDAVEAVQKFLPEVEAAGADVVVVLAHSGMGDEEYVKGEENITYQLTQVEGIDAIITGHNHATFPGDFGDLEGVDMEAGTINGTPVVMPGKFGSHLGVIDLHLKQLGGDWQVINGEAELLSIKDLPADAVVEEVIEAVEETHEATIKYVNTPIGETTAPITSFFSLVKDDPSIQLVNTAQTWYVENNYGGEYADLPILSAAAPFKAGGRNGADYYTNIPTGTIAIKNVADLYVYDNTIFGLVLTGADVKEWLEMSAGQFNQVDPSATGEQDIVNESFRTYNFDVIDGVEYEIDLTQPAKYDGDGNLVNADANRIVDLTYNGEPIDPNQEFFVVTNNYRASGNFPGVRDAIDVVDFAYENRLAIMDYLVENPVIDPSADGNWEFAPTAADATLTFETSAAAQELIPADSNISYLEALENGFAQYGIDVQ